MVSGQSTYSNDALTLLGLVLVVVVSLMVKTSTRSSTQQKWFRLVGELSSVDDLQVLQWNLEGHVLECAYIDCPCKSIGSRAYTTEELKKLMIEIAFSLHNRKADKTSSYYFEFAEFCLEQFGCNLKGLSLMCEEVRPKALIDRYRYMSVCIRYEIEARSVTDNGRSFFVGAGQARNHEQELSKFRELCHELVLDLKTFWLGIKMHGAKSNNMQQLFQLPNKIEEFSRQYYRLSVEFEQSKQLQTLFKMFQQRIVHKQSYSSNDEIVIPTVPPFLICREQRIVKFNHQFCQAYGWAQQDLTNEPIEKIMPRCFQDHHSKWVCDYIEEYDIHEARGKDGIKTVRCRQGSIAVAKSHVQILPRFEEGIELLIFLVPEQKKKKVAGAQHSFFMLLDLSSRKVVACDYEFFELVKLEQYRNRMADVLQDIKLSDLLPLFSDGEHRMLEEIRLSPTNTVKTRLNLRAIIELLKLPGTTEPIIDVQLEYVSISDKPQIQQLRLLKGVIIQDTASCHGSDSTGSLKHMAEHTSFKQPTSETERYGYSLAWWLIIGPSIACLLFRFQIDSLAQQSAFVRQQYSFLSLYLDECLEVARRVQTGTMIAPIKVSGLYSGWLQFGYSGSATMNLVSNILRGESSADDYQQYLAAMSNRPVIVEQSNGQLVVEQHSTFRNLIDMIAIGVLTLFLLGVLVDFYMNVRYALWLDDKVRKITEVLALLTQRQIDEILMDLFAIEGAFGREDFFNVDNSEVEGDEEGMSPAHLLPINFEDTDVQPKREKGRQSRVSLDAMSVMLHSISIQKEMVKDQRKRSSRKSQISACETPSLLLGLNNSTKKMLKVPAKKQEEAVAKIPVQMWWHRYSEVIPKVGLLVLLAFMLMCAFTGQFFLMRGGEASIEVAVEFQRRLSGGYPMLQEEALLMYLGIPSSYESTIDQQISKEKTEIKLIGNYFAGFKMMWQWALEDDICEHYFASEKDACDLVENGVFRLGQTVVFGTFVHRLRQLAAVNRTSMLNNPSYKSVQTILAMERTVANSLIGTFLNTLDNFSLRWQSFNISAVSTVLVLCLLYLLFVRKILEGFRNRIDRSKQLLQIIPGSILSGNEGIAKKMSGY